MVFTTHTRWFEKYLVDVPEGELGRAQVERFEVDEDGAAWHNMRAAFGGGGRIQPGEYTRLISGGTLWMSDTPSEIADHMAPISRAERWSGRSNGALASVLINGLGLGVVLQGMMKSGGVGDVTVIERDADVLALVGPHYQRMAAECGVALSLIEHDALTWTAPRGARFDIVWHDIWPDIKSDNSETMGTLHRKYARRAGWQWSWRREHVKHLQRQDRNWY